MPKIIKILCFVIIGFILGCVYNDMDSYTLWSKQLESHLRYELRTKKNVTFFIPETNIEITKLADGSGIIRIK